MSSASNNVCVYCGKECKVSDSKPCPNSKSKERIHFKCHVKKSLTDKQQKKDKDDQPAMNKPRSSFEVPGKLVDDREGFERAASAKKMSRLIDSQQTLSDRKESTFFFDVKAGIAKPHEKKRFLRHRNISEIGSRYNDQGFQEEAIGRAYDHSGKDLMTLGDPSDDEEADVKPPPKVETKLDQSSSKKPFRDQPEDPDNPGLKRFRKTPAIQIDEKNPCWFCLSSPNVEKHLIISIGEHCYLTLAKGGLSDEHFLIIPIEHIESTVSERNSKELLIELENFKQSIANYFQDQSKCVVFFERNFRSVHWQVQAVPVPIELLDQLPAAIKDLSLNHFDGLDYIDIPDSCVISDIVPPKVPYFYWQIEPTGARFASQLKIGGKSSFFPVQFGRVILADKRILNCPDRIDWKSCVKSMSSYVDLVKVIKEKYKSHNITE